MEGDVIVVGRGKEVVDHLENGLNVVVGGKEDDEERQIFASEPANGGIVELECVIYLNTLQVMPSK